MQLNDHEKQCKNINIWHSGKCYAWIPYSKWQLLSVCCCLQISLFGLNKWCSMGQNLFQMVFQEIWVSPTRHQILPSSQCGLGQDTVNSVVLNWCPILLHHVAWLGWSWYCLQIYMMLGHFKVNWDLRDLCGPISQKRYLLRPMVVWNTYMKSWMKTFHVNWVRKWSDMTSYGLGEWLGAMLQVI